MGRVLVCRLPVTPPLTPPSTNSTVWGAATAFSSPSAWPAASMAMIGCSAAATVSTAIVSVGWAATAATVIGWATATTAAACCCFCCSFAKVWVMVSWTLDFVEFKYSEWHNLINGKAKTALTGSPAGKCGEWAERLPQRCGWLAWWSSVGGRRARRCASSPAAG